MIFRFWLTSVLILLTGTVFAKDTYHYEPAIAELTGKLIEKIYYGPPGYGENPKTDSKEHATVLRLTSPIKVIADKNDEINETKNNIKELQVINIKRLPLSIYLKKNVRISGRLSSAITGHHHTDVLVEIDSIALQ